MSSLLAFGKQREREGERFLIFESANKPYLLNKLTLRRESKKRKYPTHARTHTHTQISMNCSKRIECLNVATGKISNLFVFKNSVI
jgi:hypothetical protein